MPHLVIILLFLNFSSFDDVLLIGVLEQSFQQVNVVNLSPIVLVEVQQHLLLRERCLYLSNPDLPLLSFSVNSLHTKISNLRMRRVQKIQMACS